MPMNRIARHVALLAICATAPILTDCGGGSHGEGKATTQVALKVNQDEITVLQVNEQLSKLGTGVTPEQLDPATRRVLGSLLNQQLLVQQAIERKLDRDPQVLGALEAARLNILAQAYVQRVIAPQAKPTEQEIRKYYADNPALFAERKVYRLQELTIDATPEQQSAIETAATTSKSLKQLADFLHEKKIAFSADSGVRTAEQLPLANLPKIAQLKPGSVIVFRSPGNHVSAVEVLASEAQPVDDKKAAPVIEQFLANKKREELAAADLKRLKSASKIEFVGDFAKFADVAAAAPASAASGAAAATDKPAIAAEAEKDKDKGIAALR